MSRLCFLLALIGVPVYSQAPIAELEGATKAAGAKPDAFVKLSNAYAATEQWIEAARALDDAFARVPVGAKPLTAFIRYKQADLQWRRRSLRTAVAYIQEAIRLDDRPEYRAELEKWKLLLPDTPATAEEISRAFLVGRDFDPEAVAAAPGVDLYINFEFNSDRIASSGVIQAEELGKALVSPALRQGRFRIVGHTDAIGTYEYNDGLSLRRARAVANYLRTKHGIAESRLLVEGKGKRQLLDAKTDEAAHARNRRVELKEIQ